MAQTTGAAPDYPVPETDEQEAALEKALAIATQMKLQQVLDALDSDTGKAFLEQITTLAALRLPSASQTAGNLRAMAANMAVFRQSVVNELAQVDLLINPPPPVEPIPLVPVPPVQ